MAYNLKDVFFLDATALTTTGTGDFVTNMDISSYVQPVVRKGIKPTGLAIYKVHWDIADDGSNDGLAATTTGQFRAGIFSDTGVPAGVVGAAAFANNTINSANDLAVSVMDWYGPATTAAVASNSGASMSPNPKVWLEPSTDVPYVIVRDTIGLYCSVSIATSVSAHLTVRLECAQITLDMATLNQLLRTQTV
jgi:hypothetical protein